MKKVAKKIAFGLAVALAAPLVGCYRLQAWLASAERAFPGWSQLLALVPGFTGVYLRRAFYWMVLPGCGEGTWIGFGTVFSHSTATLGRMVYVGAYCTLGDVDLEDDVLLSSHVSIANGAAQHGTDRLDVPVREQPGVWPRVRIGRDSWIGERAVVLADVGPQCLVGAGAVVTEALPARAVAVGVPARVVRYREESVQ